MDPKDIQQDLQNLIGRSVNITAKCPLCSIDMRVIAKLPMHTFILECTSSGCELSDSNIRTKIRNGKVVSILKLKEEVNS